MRSLTIRGVEDEVYDALRDLARRNHRSMQEQVKMLLEREVALTRGGQLSRCLAIRRRLEGREWGHVPLTPLPRSYGTSTFAHWSGAIF